MTMHLRRVSSSRLKKPALHRILSGEFMVPVTVSEFTAKRTPRQNVKRRPASFRPTLITSPAAIYQSCVAYAAANGFAYFKPAIEIPIGTKYSTSINSELDDIKGYSSISITLDENTASYIPSVLSFVNSNKIRPMPLLEVSI